MDPDPPDVHEELVDVIDRDDCVIGVVPRSVMRARNLWHRSVGIAVVSSDGRLLVHRRSDDKDVWPGRWDLAVGGVVASGERYEAAALRELAEEVGVAGVVPELLGEATFADDRVRCRCRMFRVVHDGPVRFTDGEVAEARWVTVDELGRLIDHERFVPDSLALLPPLLPELFAGR